MSEKWAGNTSSPLDNHFRKIIIRSIMSLVRYNKRGSPYFLTAVAPKRARMAYAMGAHIYNNYGRYKKAAKVLQRAYRRRRKRLTPRKEAFRSYARPRSARIPSKRTDEVLNETGLATTTLHTESITLPTEGSAPNQRERNIIILSGLKFCLEFSNNLTTNNLYLNVALIQDRTDPTFRGDVPNDLFFRATAGAARGQNFPLSFAILNHCRPINTDKYRVFMHKRMFLGARAVTTQALAWQEFHKRTRTLMRYIKFKKQLRFDTSNNTNGQLRLVYWASPENGTGSVPIASAFDVKGDICIYFKDPAT